MCNAMRSPPSWIIALVKYYTIKYFCFNLVPLDVYDIPLLRVQIVIQVRMCKSSMQVSHITGKNKNKKLNEQCVIKCVDAYKCIF